jgi:hypothetical protein
VLQLGLREEVKVVAQLREEVKVVEEARREAEARVAKQQRSLAKAATLMAEVLLGGDDDDGDGDDDDGDDDAAANDADGDADDARPNPFGFSPAALRLIENKRDIAWLDDDDDNSDGDDDDDDDDDDGGEGDGDDGAGAGAGAGAGDATTEPPRRQSTRARRAPSAAAAAAAAPPARQTQARTGRTPAAGAPKRPHRAQPKRRRGRFGKGPGKPRRESQFPHVYPTDSGRWRGHVLHNGVRESCGTWKTEVEAAKAVADFLRRNGRGREASFDERGRRQVPLKNAACRSRYLGVGYDDRTGKWTAQIKNPTTKRQECIGSNFATEEEAADAYDARAEELGKTTNADLGRR